MGKIGIRHTPGPWEIRRRSDGSMGITGAHYIPKGAPAIAGGFLHVCNLSGDVHHDEANAHLIAAALDLYEALSMVRDADEDCRRDGLPTIPTPARAKIDAAIAKAEGR